MVRKSAAEKKLIARAVAAASNPQSLFLDVSGENNALYKKK